MQMHQHKKTLRSLDQKAQSSQHIQRKQAKNDAATKEVQTSNHDCESLYAATEELLCASQSAVIASKTRDCQGRCHRKKRYDEKIFSWMRLTLVSNRNCIPATKALKIQQSKIQQWMRWVWPQTSAWRQDEDKWVSALFNSSASKQTN